jgi:hypothetical protein
MKKVKETKVNEIKIQEINLTRLMPFTLCIVKVHSILNDLN